jgi:DNA-binding transcriptional ArsR family regulator
MHSWQAVDALMALAHETRIAIFRAVVRAGPDGLPAGVIASRLRVAPSTLSHHLAILARSGLLTPRRSRRQVFYTCAYGGIRSLLDFLTKDCCKGHPDLCGFADSEEPQPALEVKQTSPLRRKVKVTA